MGNVTELTCLRFNLNIKEPESNSFTFFFFYSHLLYLDNENWASDVFRGRISASHVWGSRLNTQYHEKDWMNG